MSVGICTIRRGFCRSGLRGCIGSRGGGRRCRLRRWAEGGIYGGQREGEGGGQRERGAKGEGVYLRTYVYYTYMGGGGGGLYGACACGCGCSCSCGCSCIYGYTYYNKIDIGWNGPEWKV